MEPISEEARVTPFNPALLTDLYELTMAAVYFREKMFQPATFSLFIRDYPADRGYFVSAGLETVLDYLERFRFGPADIDYLRSTGRFADDFLDYLAQLRFTGEVHAMAEGEIFFKDAPVLEITAPIIQAQLAESFVLNAVSVQTTLAGKAARCVHAAGDRALIDFSLRRTQGTDAGMKVARASYMTGFKGTSNVRAGQQYGIPISGTMAHSFITSFLDESEAFRAFVREFPDDAILLIDTYDTLHGAEKAIEIAQEMAKQGRGLRGVRLDSGDMTQLSKAVRALLDQAGLTDLAIFASGGFDEYKIAQSLADGAPIDGFGVGTKMGVSADAPYLDIAYKLVQYDGRPVLKLSSGKKTLVGEKQVFRRFEDKQMAGDTIALRSESLPDQQPLLSPVMKEGKRTEPAPSLEQLRQRFARRLAALPESVCSIQKPKPYPVRLGKALEALQNQVICQVREKELGES